MLATLGWFYEDMPELPVITAGSLLEFALADHDFSMPVGLVAFQHVEPFSFREFALARGQDRLTAADAPGKLLVAGADSGPASPRFPARSALTGATAAPRNPPSVMMLGVKTTQSDQWGREAELAEIRADAMGVDVGYKLQWGRELVLTEIRCRRWLGRY